MVNVEEVYDRTEQFINDNQNTILAIIGGIVVVVGGIFAFNKFYLEPLNEKAAAEMFMAENYFAEDNFESALNGDGQYAGFLSIIDDYGRTDAGNLAHYYAGICYLRTGENEKAIEQLEKFDSDDQMLAPVALGAIGDAYAEMGDNDRAIDYYEKAAKQSDNQFTAPIFLHKAGFTALQAGNNDKAIAFFQKVKENYPESAEGRDADKYIARAQAQMN